MRKLLLIAFGIAGFSMADAALAGPADDVAACITRSTTPQDSATMAKYVFFTVAAHPAVSAYARISTADREASDREVAAMMTRLITKDCRVEIRASMATGDRQAFKAALTAAFSAMGQRSMEGMYDNLAVSEAGDQFMRYVDVEAMHQELTKP